MAYMNVQRDAFTINLGLMSDIPIAHQLPVDGPVLDATELAMGGAGGMGGEESAAHPRGSGACPAPVAEYRSTIWLGSTAWTCAECEWSVRCEWSVSGV